MERAIKMPKFLRSIGHALAYGSFFDRFAALTTIVVPIDIVLSFRDLRDWGLLRGLLLVAARGVIFSAILALIWNWFKWKNNDKNEEHTDR